MFDAIARPFGMLLMFLYDLVSNYGLALILVAIIIKVILLPFQMKGKRGQLRQSRLQPKIAELQKKHAANKQKLNEEMAKLYKDEGVNPASGCLWSFIQMPIMIALFFAIRQPLSLMMGVAHEAFEYGGIIIETFRDLGIDRFTEEVLAGPHAQVEIAQAVSQNWSVFEPLNIPGLQNISFNMGPLDLSLTPQWEVWNFPWNNFSELLPLLLLFLLPVLSGAAQFISAHIMRKISPAGSPEAAAGTMGKVIKFMPLMSVWFGFILPAALSLYWTIGTVLQIGQDIWLTKKYTKILDAEDAEKNAVRKVKEAELEAKRLESERKKAEGIAADSLNVSKKKKKKGKKQDQIDKAAEWEKKNKPLEDKEEKYEPSRVENRKYARGRAYDPDRYSGAAGDVGDSSDIDEDVEDAEHDEYADLEDLDDNVFDVDYEEHDDEDEGKGEDCDEPDDDEEDDSDDEDSDAPSSEKFDTKRFD